MKKLEYWDKGDTIFQKVWVDNIIESTLSQEKDKWPKDLVKKVEEKGYYVEEPGKDELYKEAEIEAEELSENQPSIGITEDELNAMSKGKKEEKEKLPVLERQDINEIVDSTKDDEIDNFINKNVKEYPKNKEESEDDYKNSKDMVAKPEHYNSGRYETIDKIDDFLRGKPITATTAYAIGNSLKYLDRLGHKAPDQEKGQTQSEKNAQDLLKATWYMLFATMTEKGLLPNDITPKIHEILKIMES